MRFFFRYDTAVETIADIEFFRTHRIEGKPRGDFRYARGPFCDDDDLHDDQNNKNHKADDDRRRARASAGDDVCKSLHHDALTFRKPRGVYGVCEDETRRRDIDAEPEKRHKQKHARERYEIRRARRIHDDEQDNDRKRDIERHRKIDEDARHGYDEKERNDDDCDADDIAL